MNQLLVLDDRDSRREVWHLLHRLPPRARVAFLAHCCTLVPKGNLPEPVVYGMREKVRAAHHDERGDVRLTNDVYGSLLQLFNDFALDAARTAVTLEEWVKRPSRRPPLRPACGRAPA